MAAQNFLKLTLPELFDETRRLLSRERDLHGVHSADIALLNHLGFALRDRNRAKLRDLRECLMQLAAVAGAFDEEAFASRRFAVRWRAWCEAIDMFLVVDTDGAAEEDAAALRTSEAEGTPAVLTLIHIAESAGATVSEIAAAISRDEDAVHQDLEALSRRHLFVRHSFTEPDEDAAWHYSATVRGQDVAKRLKAEIVIYNPS